MGCELGRSHMGVVGFSINDASWDGSNAQLGQYAFTVSFSKEGESSDVQYSPASNVASAMRHSCHLLER